MQKTLRLLMGMAAGVSLAACGANPNNPTAPSNPAPIAKNVLQLAVGTANLFGTNALNVVTTYRQPAGSLAPGDSGTLLNSITLTLPASVPGPAGTATTYDCLSTAPTGPGAGDVGTDTLTSTSQSLGNAASCPAGNVSTFGQSGGVFGLGIEPYNTVGAGTAAGSGNPAGLGAPFQVAPYPVPLLDQTNNASAGSDPNSFIPWGGPPSFVLTGSNGQSVVGNGNYPHGTAGVSQGINVFDVPPATGQYTLSVLIPANTGNVTQTQNATLGSVVTLPLPTNPAFTMDGSGGGSLSGFSVASPATEAYVQIVDFGPALQGSGSSATQPASCNGASTGAPIYYTIQTTSTPGNLADAIGPAGAMSVCNAAQNNALSANAGITAGGDQLVIQVITFDYPAFEMSYPNSLKNPSPKISTGPTDDLAVSAATCQFVDGGSCNGNLPLLRKREFAAAYAKRMLIRH